MACGRFAGVHQKEKTNDLTLKVIARGRHQ
jgi:hypothetical protein